MKKTITYQEITPGQVVGPVDVCIIGSGAGGSVMAHYLTRAGLKVAVLEKGGHYPSEELGRKEVALLTRIEGMTIFHPATGDHTRVSLITGECVGGGTVASESVTWDFPLPVLDDWERMGLKSWARSTRFAEHQAELNKLLSVRPVEMTSHNGCNQILMIGAEREGLSWKSIDRPVTYCMRCGNCTQGCRYEVKQDAANTFLTWALDVAEHLSKPSRKRIAVNLSRINMYTEKSETVVVPGKVLGSGVIDHAVTVAAFDASAKAKAKLAAAKAKYLSIAELVEKNPHGSNVRIIG